MNFRLILISVPVAALSACGSFAPNSNASGSVNLAGATVQDTSGVQVVTKAPASAVEISGIDCKNKIWNPTPTNARAIDVLKSQTKQAGYTHVMVKSVLAVPSPISINCWSALEAKGLAY